MGHSKGQMTQFFFNKRTAWEMYGRRDYYSLKALLKKINKCNVWALFGSLTNHKETFLAQLEKIKDRLGITILRNIIYFVSVIMVLWYIIFKASY